MSKEITFKAYNWIAEAKIFNKRFYPVDPKWLSENTDAVVLLFTANGVDRNGVIEKFYEIYENVKYKNMPVEVIYVPLEDDEASMLESYKNQANWFTLKFGDPMIVVLMYLFEVTCIPHIIVLGVDGSTISRNGIADIEEYGGNCVISWLGTAASTKNHRQFKRESWVYGDDWNFLKVEGFGKKEHPKIFILDASKLEMVPPAAISRNTKREGSNEVHEDTSVKENGKGDKGNDAQEKKEEEQRKDQKKTF